MLRRILTVLALAAVSLIIAPSSIPAHANPVSEKIALNGNSAPGASGLDGTWSCYVPSGYTWDQVEPTGTCGSLSYRYRLRTPVSGLWACAIPFGWTYDSVRSTSVCGSTSPYQYRLLG